MVLRTGAQGVKDYIRTFLNATHVDEVSDETVEEIYQNCLKDPKYASFFGLTVLHKTPKQKS